MAQTDLNGSLSEAPDGRAVDPRFRFPDMSCRLEAADSLLGIRLASVGERSSLVPQSKSFWGGAAEQRVGVCKMICRLCMGFK